VESTYAVVLVHSLSLVSSEGPLPQLCFLIQIVYGCLYNSALAKVHLNFAKFCSFSFVFRCDLNSIRSPIVYGGRFPPGIFVLGDCGYCSIVKVLS